MSRNNLALNLEIHLGHSASQICFASSYINSSLQQHLKIGEWHAEKKKSAKLRGWRSFMALMVDSWLPVLHLPYKLISDQCSGLMRVATRFSTTMTDLGPKPTPAISVPPNMFQTDETLSMNATAADFNWSLNASLLSIKQIRFGAPLAFKILMSQMNVLFILK